MKLKTKLLCIFSFIIISTVSCDIKMDIKDIPRFLILKEKKYGYIDINGKIVIEPQFDNAKEFKNGIASVAVNKKWGCINYKGDYLIMPQYEDLGVFNKELIAAAQINKKYGYINLNGRWIIEPEYDYAMEFLKNIACVVKDDRYWFINKSGKKITDLTFEFGALNQRGWSILDIYYFKEESIRVTDNHLMGLLNKNGELIVKMEHTAIYEFINGYATVMENKEENNFIPQRNMVDPKGNFLFKEFVAACGPMGDNNLIPIKFNHKDKFGYINKKMEFIIKPQFDNVHTFYNNRAAVMNWDKYDGKYGYTDAKGNMVIKPQFDEAGDFEFGVAIVKLNNQYAIIDPTGAFLLNYQKYEIGPEFINGMNKIYDWEKNQFGFVNIKGEIIYKPQFDIIWDLRMITLYGAK